MSKEVEKKSELKERRRLFYLFFFQFLQDKTLHHEKGHLVRTRSQLMVLECINSHGGLHQRGIPRKKEEGDGREREEGRGRKGWKEEGGRDRKRRKEREEGKREEKNILEK